MNGRLLTREQKIDSSRGAAGVVALTWLPEETPVPLGRHHDHCASAIPTRSSNQRGSAPEHLSGSADRRIGRLRDCMRRSFARADLVVVVPWLFPNGVLSTA